MHKDDDKKYKAKCMRMRQKIMRRTKYFFASSKFILLCTFCHHPSAYHKDGFCHHPSALHKDEGKKHKAKYIMMRQKSMRRSRILFASSKCILLNVLCHYQSAINPWDIKCCWPWTTFLNTWKIPLEKTLGFFKHLKKCFMGCLVQVSQTPPPAEVSIKCTPQSNRYNTRCLPDFHLFRYNYAKVLYFIEITMYFLPDT